MGWEKIGNDRYAKLEVVRRERLSRLYQQVARYTQLLSIPENVIRIVHRLPKTVNPMETMAREKERLEALIAELEAIED